MNVKAAVRGAALAAALACVQPAAAQGPPSRVAESDGRVPHDNLGAQNPEEAAAKAKAALADYVTSLYWYGTGVLVLTGLVVLGEFIIMWQRGHGWDDWNSLRIVVVTLALGLASFLVVAGFSANQMAAVIGLMGAAIGYVFGKEPPAGSNGRASAGPPSAAGGPAPHAHAPPALPAAGGPQAVAAPDEAAGR